MFFSEGRMADVGDVSGELFEEQVVTLGVGEVGVGVDDDEEEFAGFGFEGGRSRRKLME